MLCGWRTSNSVLSTTTSLAIFSWTESIGVAATSSPTELFTTVLGGTVVERRLELFTRTHGGTQPAQVYQRQSISSLLVSSLFSHSFSDIYSYRFSYRRFLLTLLCNYIERTETDALTLFTLLSCDVNMTFSTVDAILWLHMFICWLKAFCLEIPLCIYWTSQLGLSKMSATLEIIYTSIS